MGKAASVTHPNLFGIETRKRQQQPKGEPTPPGVIQRLISLYAEAYQRRFHEPPVILKRDGPLLRNLVKQFGAMKVEQRLLVFMAWDDDFVVSSGFALTMFHSNWNRLTAMSVQAQPAERGTVRGADATAAYLQQLRNAR